MFWKQNGWLALKRLLSFDYLKGERFLQLAGFMFFNLKDKKQKNGRSKVI